MTPFTANEASLLLDVLATQQRLLAQSALLLDHQEKEQAARERQLDAVSATLRDSVRQLENGGQQLARDALHAFAQHGAQALSGIQQQCDGWTQASQTARQELEQGTQALRRQRSLWSWTAPLALVIGAVLVTLGSGWQVWHARQELQQIRIQTDLLRAYNAADVTLCEGQLCANVEPDGKRHGERRQYRLVRPRP